MPIARSHVVGWGAQLAFLLPRRAAFDKLTP